MSLEITGKLISKLPMQSGTSARTGSTWQKQEFVIETGDQFPKKICANLWGDKADQLNQYNIGDPVKVSFDLESREFNGKWYTDVKAWKLEHPQVGVPGMQQPPMPDPTAFNPTNIQTQHTAYTAPASTLPDLGPAEDTFSDNGMPDDLPF